MKWHDRAAAPGRLLAVPAASKARKPKYVRLLVDAMQFFEDPRGITIPWFVRYCHVMRSVPLEQSLRLAQRVLSHGISTGVVAKRRQYVFLVEHPAAAMVKKTGAALGGGGGGASHRPMLADRSEKVASRRSRVLLSPPRRRHRSRSRERHSHHHHHHHNHHRSHGLRR